MTQCDDTSIRTLGDVRSFLQIPNPRNCGRQTLYYGRNCQLMEVDGVTRNIRTAGTPIRTWNRRTRSWCVIGNTESPPDNPQVTLRFYEECGQGIPLPHVLGECRIRVINNYGLCSSNGTITGGWNDYVEVMDIRLLSENRGRRSSNDGTDDPLVNEFTGELLQIFDIGTVSFSAIDLTNAQGNACTPGELRFNNSTFGCFTGCGRRDCGCDESCDNGTYTFFIPASCNGSTTGQYVIYTNDGGDSINTLVLPQPSAGGVATMFPQVAVIGNFLYVLAYENPATLFEIALDERGNPISTTEIYTLELDDNDNVVTTGTPAQLVVDGDDLHILITDGVTGDRLYTFGGNYTPADGPRFTFPVAVSPVGDFSVCADVMLAGGAGGVVYHSEDSGFSWEAIASPTTDDITAVEVVDGRYWIGTTAGEIYYSSDEGDNWEQIQLTGVASSINSFAWANDDVGWLVGNDGVIHSTWIGGLERTDWTNSTERINSLPTTIDDLLHAAIPTCADAVYGANTLLLTGTNANGEYVAYIGRVNVSGF